MGPPAVDARAFRGTLSGAESQGEAMDRGEATAWQDEPAATIVGPPISNRDDCDAVALTLDVVGRPDSPVPMSRWRIRTLLQMTQFLSTTGPG